jgi:hypothetical protein
MELDAMPFRFGPDDPPYIRRVGALGDLCVWVWEIESVQTLPLRWRRSVVRSRLLNRPDEAVKAVE